MELHEQTWNKVGMRTNVEQSRNMQFQNINAATQAFGADFHCVQSWNKVGETFCSQFVQDLRS